MWITCISLPNYFPLFHSATCSLFLCFTFNLSWIWIIPLTSTTWTRKLPQSQDQQRLSLIFSIACITLLPLTSSDPSRGKHNLSLCFPFFIFFYSFPILMLYIFFYFLYAFKSSKRNQYMFIVSFIITATFTSVLPIYPFMSSIIQYYYRHGVLWFTNK